MSGSQIFYNQSLAAILAACRVQNVRNIFIFITMDVIQQLAHGGWIAFKILIAKHLVVFVGLLLAEVPVCHFAL